MNLDQVGDVFAGGYLLLGGVVGAVVALAGRSRSGPAIERVSRTQVLVPVAVSIVALVGVYVCTPDTEMARLFLGGGVGAGVVAVALSMPWLLQVHAVTGLVVLAALFDGRSRASAVIGTLATAAVHAIAQSALQRDRPLRFVSIMRARGVAVLIVAVIATAVTSRVAGLADSVVVALAISAAAVGAAALVLAPSTTTDG